jgi:hypothetical protein
VHLLRAPPAVLAAADGHNGLEMGGFQTSHRLIAVNPDLDPGKAWHPTRSDAWQGVDSV